MWNPRQLPTTPSDIDKAIVRFSERKERYVPRREALDRIKVLRSKKIQLPLQTKFVLVRSGGAFAQCLLETGDDLCCMEGGADRGFSVLNTAPELADNALSEEVVVELLANQPEAMRAAANLRRPDTGAVPAYGWIGSAKVLKALEPIADVSLWDVRDDNGNSLLHHAATRHASVLSDPRVIEFLRDGCQPRRKLRSFVGATNDDGMTAADLLFDYRHSHSAVEDAILALYTTSNNRSGDSGSGSSGDGGSSGGGSSSGDGRHGPGCNCGPAPRETAVDMLLREHAAMKREETRTRKLVAQEQVAVCFAATADGSAAPAAPPAPPLLAPLSIIESSEVLLAELERWQPSVIRAQEKNDEGAASGGSDRSLRRRKPSANGKGKSSAAAAAAAAAEEAAAVAEEEAAVAAAAALTAAAGASGQRSVTVGHTGRAVVTAWLETASVLPTDERGVELGYAGAFMGLAGLDLGAEGLGPLMHYDTTVPTVVGLAMAAGVAVDLFQRSGSLSQRILRGMNRLFLRDVERESRCEAAGFLCAYLAGLPCFAFEPNVFEAVRMVQHPDAALRTSLDSAGGVHRVLVWLLAAVAAEAATHRQLICSDPRQAQAFLAVCRERGVAGGTESLDPADDAARIDWAYNEARALLRENEAAFDALRARLETGGATVGECVSLLERLRR